MIDKKKFRKADVRGWKDKFFIEIPMMDKDGKPIPWNPPLNTRGFWVKPEKTLSHELSKNIKEVRGRIEGQRKNAKN